MSVFEQGDLIEVDFSPSVGHEPAKVRPAVVVSCFGFNSRSSLVAVVPVATNDNGYPLHVAIDCGGVHGFACVEGLRTLDLERREHRMVGYVDEPAMRKIVQCVRGMLDIR